jgi:hypothetical protein
MIIEKRIRKHARLSSLFGPKDSIICLDEISHLIVRSMYKDTEVDCTLLKEAPKDADGSIILEKWTADDVVEDYLVQEVKGKGLKLKERKSLLSVSTDHELGLFAQHHGLSWSPNRRDPHIKRFLDVMESRYPETRHALLKSVEEIQKLLK